MVKPCGSTRHFNPHSPCGERQDVDIAAKRRCISIHTPLAGSDLGFRAFHRLNAISIHTPLAGSDNFSASPCGLTVNFNPHSPCGERLTLPVSNTGLVPFQSTLPLRGATAPFERWCDDQLFQSTLPLRGATVSARPVRCPDEFQSTLPLRGATFTPSTMVSNAFISIHTPLAGSDQC